MAVLFDTPSSTRNYHHHCYLHPKLRSPTLNYPVSITSELLGTREQKTSLLTRAPLWVCRWLCKRPTDDFLLMQFVGSPGTKTQSAGQGMAQKSPSANAGAFSANTNPVVQGLFEPQLPQTGVSKHRRGSSCSS